jgi:ribosomal-protein-alanine N-acetyltransferase
VSSPEDKEPGSDSDKTGAPDSIQVAPVSHFWLSDLVRIDSTWNPRSWSERLFQSELDNPAARVRGVFVRELLVGYIITHVVLDEGHIVSFGIDPKWRKRGLGCKLLEDTLRAISLEGVRVVTLQARSSNTAAISLYQKLGFKIVGVRKKYYSDNGEDAITMRL